MKERIFLVGSLLLCNAVGNASVVSQYSVTDLGTLGGTNSQATAINNRGEVVGYCYSDGAFRAFLYSGGTIHALGTFGGASSHAWDINDSGQIVGYANTSGNAALHAFVHSGSGPLTPTDDLGTLGGTHSYAYSINNRGQIAGSSYINGNATQHVFLHSGSGPITANDDLGTLPGATRNGPSGVNDSGQIVGSAYTSADANWHAYSHSGSGPLTVSDELGTFGGSQSWASDINDSGQIVGYAYTSTLSTFHAFLHNGSGPLTAADDLGTLGGQCSEAFGINNSGQVVGASYFSTAGLGYHAFLYSGGLMQDLNSLIAPDSGWTLQYACDVNDRGQIAGYGINPDGKTHAFLLTPVPEPSTLVLLGIGAIGLLSFGRRRLHPRHVGKGGTYAGRRTGWVSGRKSSPRSVSFPVDFQQLSD